MGAIYPPMANIVMMYDALGKDENFPPRATTRRGLDKLLVIKGEEAYCQPCVSPIWDTTLTAHALLEAGGDKAVPAAKQGLDWLIPKQELEVRGDWAVKRPDVRPGGWAFQYNNAHYPDLDDTAVVVMSMDRMRKEHGATGYDAAIDRAREWIVGMQSDDGGWAAFDVNNFEYYLNNIPSGPARRDRDNQQGGRARRRLPAQDPAPRGLLVWPLGHELHLWDLVGPVRPQHGRGRPRGSDDAQGGRLAGLDPEPGRRLGRGRRQLPARLQRLGGRPLDRLANGMGLACPDGCWRG